MYKLYGIPNCDTVKKARTFLDSKNVAVTFVDFKKTAPTQLDIKRWQKAFGDLPVNTKGATYKKFKDEYESGDLNQKINFLIQNTSMIKRPILEKEGEVLAFGFEASLYQKLFS